MVPIWGHGLHYQGARVLPDASADRGTTYGRAWRGLLFAPRTGWDAQGTNRATTADLALAI